MFGTKGLATWLEQLQAISQLWRNESFQGYLERKGRLKGRHGYQFCTILVIYTCLYLCGQTIQRLRICMAPYSALFQSSKVDSLTSVLQ